MARIARLTLLELQHAEVHGRRGDKRSRGRIVRDTPPITWHGEGDQIDPLALEQRYHRHVKGAFIPKGKAAALHLLVKFPESVPVESAVDAEAALRMAVDFAQRVFGGDAVFGARLDRDEKSLTNVDLFLAPKYEKVTKHTGKLAISTTRHLKLMAEKHGPLPQDSDILRAQGRALQDAFAEFIRSRGYQAIRGQPKVAKGPDWISPERYGMVSDLRIAAADRQVAMQDRMELEDRLSVKERALDEQSVALAARIKNVEDDRQQALDTALGEGRQILRGVNEAAAAARKLAEAQAERVIERAEQDAQSIRDQALVAADAERAATEKQRTRVGRRSRAVDRLARLKSARAAKNLGQQRDAANAAIAAAEAARGEAEAAAAKARNDRDEAEGAQTQALGVWSAVLEKKKEVDGLSLAVKEREALVGGREAAADDRDDALLRLEQASAAERQELDDAAAASRTAADAVSDQLRRAKLATANRDQTAAAADRAAAEMARATAAAELAAARTAERQLQLVGRALHDESLKLVEDDGPRGVGMLEAAMNEEEKVAYLAPWLDPVRNVARAVAAALARARAAARQLATEQAAAVRAATVAKADAAAARVERDAAAADRHTVEALRVGASAWATGDIVSTDEQDGTIFLYYRNAETRDRLHDTVKQAFHQVSSFIRDTAAVVAKRVAAEEQAARTARATADGERAAAVKLKLQAAADSAKAGRLCAEAEAFAVGIDAWAKGEIIWASTRESDGHKLIGFAPEARDRLRPVLVPVWERVSDWVQARARGITAVVDRRIGAEADQRMRAARERVTSADIAAAAGRLVEPRHIVDIIAGRVSQEDAANAAYQQVLAQHAAVYRGR